MEFAWKSQTHRHPISHFPFPTPCHASIAVLAFFFFFVPFRTHYDFPLPVLFGVNFPATYAQRKMPPARTSISQSTGWRKCGWMGGWVVGWLGCCGCADDTPGRDMSGRKCMWRAWKGGHFLFPNWSACKDNPVKIAIWAPHISGNFLESVCPRLPPYIFVNRRLELCWVVWQSKTGTVAL